MLSGPHAKVVPVSSETEQTATQRRNLLFLGIAGGTGIAALVVVLATLLLTGSASAAGAAELVKTQKISDACTQLTFKDRGQAHTDNINAKIKYNSFPPTSGTHYVDPARWGLYPSPISQVQGVHNLEHGGIVIQYGSKVSSDTQDELFEYYDDDPSGILMAPLPRLGSRVIATAWTQLLTCTKFDKKALDKFKKAYRYKGPERLPKEALEPGR
jgi:hypothetical protein